MSSFNLNTIAQLVENGQGHVLGAAFVGVEPEQAIKMVTKVESAKQSTAEWLSRVFEKRSQEGVTTTPRARNCSMRK